MRLEVGNDYMTRTGERVRIVAVLFGQMSGFIRQGDSDRFLGWNTDGSYVSAHEPYPLDLVCEWPIVRDRLGRVIQRGSVLVGTLTGRVCIARRPVEGGWRVLDIGHEWAGTMSSVMRSDDRSCFEVVGNVGRPAGEVSYVL